MENIVDVDVSSTLELFEKAQEKLAEAYGQEVYDRWIKNTIFNMVSLPLANSHLVEHLSVNDVIRASIMDYGLVENDVTIARFSLAKNINPGKKYYLVKQVDVVMLYELTNYSNIVGVACPLPDSLAVKSIITLINYTIANKVGNKLDKVYYSVYSDNGIPVSLYPRFVDEGDKATLLLTNSNNGDEASILELVVPDKDLSVDKQYMSVVNRDTNENYVIEILFKESIYVPNPSGIIPDVLAVQFLDNDLSEKEGILDNDERDPSDPIEANVRIEC